MRRSNTTSCWCRWNPGTHLFDHYSQSPEFLDIFGMNQIFKALKRLGDGLPGLLHGLLPRAIRSVRQIRRESVPVDSVSRAEDVAAPGLRQTFGTTVLEGAVEPLSLHLAQGDRLDARGMMPFFLACSRNEVHACRLLLDAGADPSVQTATGTVPLH